MLKLSGFHCGVPVLGGSWHLLSTSNQAYDPSCSLPNWPCMS